VFDGEFVADTLVFAERSIVKLSDIDLDASTDPDTVPTPLIVIVVECASDNDALKRSLIDVVRFCETVSLIDSWMLCV